MMPRRGDGFSALAVVFIRTKKFVNIQVLNDSLTVILQLLLFVVYGKIVVDTRWQVMALYAFILFLQTVGVDTQLSGR